MTFTPSSEDPKRNASLEGLVSARNTELALEPLYGGSWEEGSLDDFAAGLEERIEFLEANRKVTLSTDLINGPCLIPHHTKTELVTAEAKPFRLTLHPAMLLGKFREGKASIIRDLEAHGDALEDLTETPLETPAMGANLADPSQAGAIADLRTGKHIVLCAAGYRQEPDHHGRHHIRHRLGLSGRRGLPETRGTGGHRGQPPGAWAPRRHCQNVTRTGEKSWIRSGRDSRPCLTGCNIPAGCHRGL